jgi:hypothetical protein
MTQTVVVTCESGKSKHPVNVTSFSRYTRRSPWVENSSYTSEQLRKAQRDQDPQSALLFTRSARRRKATRAVADGIRGPGRSDRVRFETQAAGKARTEYVLNCDLCRMGPNTYKAEDIHRMLDEVAAQGRRTAPLHFIAEWVRLDRQRRPRDPRDPSSS